MGLEGILGVIERDCAARHGEIETRCSAEIDDFLAGAREKADRVRRAACEEIAGPAERDRLGQLHAARLDALQMVEAARSEILELVLARIREGLAGARRSPGYQDLLERLLEQALAELAGSLEPGEAARLSADPDDLDLVEGYLRSVDPRPAVDYDRKCLGGVRAMSPDGRILVDNTLETRLERAWPSLRAAVVRFLEVG